MISQVMHALVASAADGFFPRSPSLQIATKLLRAGTLQLRISGLVELRCCLSAVDTRQSECTSKDEDELVRAIVSRVGEDGLLELLFSPHYLHAELIKRCGDVMRVMARQRELQESHLRLMWEAATSQGSHESIKHELLCLLGSLCSDMGIMQLGCLQKLLQGLSIAEFDAHVLRLLRSTAMATLQSGGECEALDLLWTCIQDSSKLPYDLHESALMHLLQISCSGGVQDRIRLAKVATAALVEGRSVVQSLRVLEALVRSLEKPQGLQLPASAPDKEEVHKEAGEPAVVATSRKRQRLELSGKDLAEQERLLDRTLTDLERYQAAAKVCAAEKSLKGSEVDGVVLQGAYYTHHDAIIYRMRFIQYHLTALRLAVTAAQVNVLWRATARGTLSETEQDQMYDAILAVQKDPNGGKSWSILAEIFFERMCDERFEARAMRPSAFRLFVACMRTNARPARVVMSSDQDLPGPETLWRVLLEGTNERTAGDAIKVLCEENLLRDEGHSGTGCPADAMRAGFIARSITRLRDACVLGKHDSVLRCLRLIVSYAESVLGILGSSGIDVVHHGYGARLGVDPLAHHEDQASPQGPVQSPLNGMDEPITLFVQGPALSKLQMTLSGSASVLDLANEVTNVMGAKNGVSISPQLVRMFYRGRELKNHALKLSQCGDIDGETIIVQRRPEPSLVPTASDSSVSPSAKPPPLVVTELSRAELFDTLFGILEAARVEGSSLRPVIPIVWDFLLKIPSQVDLVRQLTDLRGPELTLQSLFLQPRLDRLMYTLQLVQTLIYDGHNVPNAYLEKLKASGGGELLLQRFQGVVLPPHESDEDYGTLQCLRLLLEALNLLGVAGTLCRKNEHGKSVVEHMLRLLPDLVQSANACTCSVAALRLIGQSLGSSEGSGALFSALWLWGKGPAAPAITAAVFSALVRSPDITVREAAKDTVSEIASYAGLPAVLLLLFSIAKDIRTCFEAMQCFELFEVICALLPRLTDGERAELARRLGAEKGLLYWTYELLCTHEPFETWREISCVDQRLAGLLKTMTSLVSLMPRSQEPCPASNPDALWDHIWRHVQGKCLMLLPDMPPPQCKSLPSRSAAFSLLKEITLRSRLLAAQAVKAAVEAHCSLLCMNSTMGWFYAPSPGRAACGYVGIKNLGATCYMNSLLNQLYMAPSLRYGVLHSQPEKDPQNLLYQLQMLFARLHESDQQTTDARGICAAYRDTTGQPVNPNEQHDADEFMVVFLDRLEACLADVPDKALLKRVFGGQVCNQLIGMEEGSCTHVSERVENFFVLSLEVKGKRSILDSLDLYVEGEVLDGDNKFSCSACHGAKRTTLKRACVSQLPNVLFLHLKRFDFDLDYMRKVKLNDYCEFPFELDMLPYTKEGLEGAVEGLERRRYMYNLVGVVVHAGTADSGHYYSYVKERSAGGSSKAEGTAARWLWFNDSSVVEYHPEMMAACCFGGSEAEFGKNRAKTFSAYMLIYEREAAESYVEMGTAAPSSPLEAEGRESLSLFSALPLPPAVQQVCWEEKRVYSREKVVMSPTYLTWLLEITEHLLADFSTVRFAELNPDKGEAISEGARPQMVHRDALRLLTITLFDIIIRVGDLSPLQAWGPALRRWFEASDDLSADFLTFFTENPNWINFLLYCPSAGTRRLVIDILLACLPSAQVSGKHLSSCHHCWETLRRPEASLEQWQLEGTALLQLNASDLRDFGAVLAVDRAKEVSVNADILPCSVTEHLADKYAHIQPEHCIGQLCARLFDLVDSLADNLRICWKHSEELWSFLLELASRGLAESTLMIQGGGIQRIVDAMHTRKFNSRPFATHVQSLRLLSQLVRSCCSLPSHLVVSDVDLSPAECFHSAGKCSVVIDAKHLQDCLPTTMKDRVMDARQVPCLRTCDRQSILSSRIVMRKILQSASNDELILCTEPACDLLMHLCWSSTVSTKELLHYLRESLTSISDDGLPLHLRCLFSLTAIKDSLCLGRYKSSMMHFRSAYLDNVRDGYMAEAIAFLVQARDLLKGSMPKSNGAQAIMTNWLCSEPTVLLNEWLLAAASPTEARVLAAEIAKVTIIASTQRLLFLELLLQRLTAVYELDADSCRVSDYFDLIHACIRGDAAESVTFRKYHENFVKVMLRLRVDFNLCAAIACYLTIIRRHDGPARELQATSPVVLSLLSWRPQMEGTIGEQCLVYMVEVVRVVVKGEVSRDLVLAVTQSAELEALISRYFFGCDVYPKLAEVTLQLLKTCIGTVGAKFASRVLNWVFLCQESDPGLRGGLSTHCFALIGFIVNDAASAYPAVLLEFIHKGGAASLTRLLHSLHTGKFSTKIGPADKILFSSCFEAWAALLRCCSDKGLGQTPSANISVQSCLKERWVNAPDTACLCASIALSTAPGTGASRFLLQCCVWICSWSPQAAVDLTQSLWSGSVLLANGREGILLEPAGSAACLSAVSDGTDRRVGEILHSILISCIEGGHMEALESICIAAFEARRADHPSCNAAFAGPISAANILALVFRKLFGPAAADVDEGGDNFSYSPIHSGKKAAEMYDFCAKHAQPWGEAAATRLSGAISNALGRVCCNLESGGSEAAREVLDALSPFVHFLLSRSPEDARRFLSRNEGPIHKIRAARDASPCTCNATKLAYTKFCQLLDTASPPLA
jgi:ubiquitin C-terminal hydrolase